MPKWVLGHVLTIVGMLAAQGPARAQGTGSSSFGSEAQARAYLRDNPTGPLAKAAFVAIVEFQLARDNPGFTRAEIAQNFNLGKASGASGARRTTGSGGETESGSGGGQGGGGQSGGGQGGGGQGGGQGGGGQGGGGQGGGGQY